MWRVELVERTTYAGDISRISSACKSDDDIIKKIESLKKDFNDEIKTEKYYISIIYVNIRKEEKEEDQKNDR